jgi:AcrR family transcriptional regulator
MAAPLRGGSAKQDAIISAATRLFSHYGFRKTTVDLIAHEADVAKPTLYAHFGDKEAIFVAVCQHVVDGILAAAETELDRDDVIDRIAGVLSAKFTKVFELIDSSPHARELLESQDAQAREVVARADAAFAKLLTDALRSAFRRGELGTERIEARPAKLAQLLMQAGHGAAYGATSVEDQRANLRALVAALLGRPAS